MTVSLFQLFVLLGIAMGTVSASVILLTRYRQGLGNRILAVILIALAVTLLGDQFLDFPHITNYLVLDAALGFLGPLVYLYVETYVSAPNRLSGKQWGYFLPAAAITCLFIFLSLEFAWTGQEQTLMQALSETGELVLALSMVGQTLVFLVLASLRLRRYQDFLESQYSSYDERRMHWLHRFVASVIFILVIDLTMGTQFPFLPMSIRPLLDFWFDGAFACLLIGTCVYALVRPELLGNRLKVVQQREFSTIEGACSVEKSSEEESREEENCEGESSGHGARENASQALELSAAQSKRLASLEAYMQTQSPYLLADLSLTQLAAEVGIPSRELSQLINQGKGLNFYNYVNGYRLERVKQKLADPSEQTQKIEVLALESGFRSTSTFNRLFKEKVRSTPQQYRAQQIENLSTKERESNLSA